MITLPPHWCLYFNVHCLVPPQELQGLVVRLREDMVALRTSADHMEEKLKAEILFLKEQIQAEQCLKENLEDTLQLEIEGCKEEIGETWCEHRPMWPLTNHRSAMWLVSHPGLPNLFQHGPENVKKKKTAVSPNPNLQ